MAGDRCRAAILRGRRPGSRNIPQGAFVAPPGLDRRPSREATILLYAPALDPHLQKLTELADRVFCIYSEQAPAKGRKAEAKMPGAQRTLEAYS